jgi:hypothetical protein
MIKIMLLQRLSSKQIERVQVMRYAPVHARQRENLQSEKVVERNSLIL